MESVARLLLIALSELRPAERLSAGASRITAAAVFSAAAAVALTAALACLVAAGWIALIPIVGPAGAALIAAVGLAIVAGILWFLARSRYPHEHQEHAHTNGQSHMHHFVQSVLGENGMDEVKRLWAENKMPVLLAALVAGMSMGGTERGHEER
jgi:hypothetical protein